MSIKAKIINKLESNYNLRIRKKVADKILDKNFLVLEGSIRTDDYDDAWLFSLSKRAKKVFDVGCNMGQSSMLILAYGNIEKMVCIDPNPSALSIAAENLIFNGLSQAVHFVPSFASDSVGKEVEFFTVGAGAAGSMFKGHAKTAGNMNSSIKVPTTTLDILVQDMGFIPDLVKIDVEGAESLVLKGAVKLASHGESRFLVEMHSHSELPMKKNADLVLEWCQTTHYKAWYLKQKVDLSDSAPIVSRGRCHLLLQPEAWEFPKHLLGLEQGASLEKVI